MLHTKDRTEKKSRGTTKPDIKRMGDISTLSGRERGETQAERRREALTAKVWRKEVQKMTYIVEGAPNRQPNPSKDFLCH
jgi:hypothetical protein